MVSSTPRAHFTLGKDPVPILQEAGWAPGPVWTGGKCRPLRDSIPDRPVLSSVTIATEIPGAYTEKKKEGKNKTKQNKTHNKTTLITILRKRHYKLSTGTQALNHEKM